MADQRLALGRILMSETSISLLDRLRLQPDDLAWKRFVDLYTPLIRGWLRRYSVNQADAADLAQEVMLAVVRELPQFSHNHKPGAFRNWLRPLTVNRLQILWPPPRARSPRHR